MTPRLPRLLHTILCLAPAAVPGLALAAEPVVLEDITVRGEQQAPGEEQLMIREVRESPARDLGEALQQVPGVEPLRKGAIATDVVLRGFQRDNIDVLIDGVRVQGACPGRMDPPLFHLDFAEVESVTVTKGPYDLSRPGGPGGRIMVNSRQPRPGLGLDLDLGYGSFEAINAAAALTYAGPRLEALAGYAFKTSQAPVAGDGRRITEVAAFREDELDRAAYSINTGWASLGLRTGDRSKLSLSYSYQDAEDVLYPYLKMDADYDRTHRVNLRYQVGGLSSLLRIVKVQGYWDQVDHLMDDHLRQSSEGKPRAYSMRTEALSAMAGANAAATLALGPGNLELGLDAQRRLWDATNQRGMFTAQAPYSDYAMIPDVALDTFGAHAGYVLGFAPQWQVSGALRADLSQAEARSSNGLTEEAGSERTFREGSGNLQLQWQPIQELTLVAGAGRGTRPPDPQELFLHLPGAVTWSGNPDLRPSVNHQADLGAKYARSGLFASASVFYSAVQDFIDFERLDETTKGYANVDARLWGGELAVQVALPAHLFFEGALSYVQGRNVDGDRPLAEMPPLGGSGGLRFDTGSVFVALSERFALAQDRVDEALGESETEGWAVTDLKAGGTLGPLALYAGVRNLFDRHYVRHLSYQRDPFMAGVKVPEEGRALYVTATARY